MESQEPNTSQPDLAGAKIAIFVANGFHQDEFNTSKDFLAQCGATTRVVSPEPGKVLGFEANGRSNALRVDAPLQTADEAGYDALLIPGGRHSISTLLENHRAIEFVRAFLAGEKPIAAISHAPFLLIKAGALSGRRVTSEPTIQNDLKNAGAEWINESMVVHKNVVTGQGGNDLVAFNSAFSRLCFGLKKAAGSSLHTDQPGSITNL
jgi:deglycase